LTVREEVNVFLGLSLVAIIVADLIATAIVANR